MVKLDKASIKKHIYVAQLPKMKENGNCIHILAEDIDQAQEIMAVYYPFRLYTIGKCVKEDSGLKICDRLPHRQNMIVKMENEDRIDNLKAYGIDYKDDKDLA